MSFSGLPMHMCVVSRTHMHPHAHIQNGSRSQPRQHASIHAWYSLFEYWLRWLEDCPSLHWWTQLKNIWRASGTPHFTFVANKGAPDTVFTPWSYTVKAFNIMGSIISLVKMHQGSRFVEIRRIVRAPSYSVTLEHFHGLQRRGETSNKDSVVLSSK